MRWNDPTNLARRCAGSSSLRVLKYAILAAFVAHAAGCLAAAGVGVKLVGSAVDDADVNERQKQLMGADVARADAAFGEPVDTFSDINSNRAWRAYKVPKDKDPLGKDSYVVEVAEHKIVAISRVEKNSSIKIDLPRAIAIKSDVKGKPIAECEALVDHGKPLVTVRSASTGLLTQMYEGRIFKGKGKSHYIVLRFDEQELCTDVEFMGVGASTQAEHFGDQSDTGSGS